MNTRRVLFVLLQTIVIVAAIFLFIIPMGSNGDVWFFIASIPLIGSLLVLWQEATRPAAVLARPGGLMFRNKDGSESYHPWEEIREMRMAWPILGLGAGGMVRLAGFWYHVVPVPPEAIEDAAVARRKASTTGLLL